MISKAMNETENQMPREQIATAMLDMSGKLDKFSKVNITELGKTKMKTDRRTKIYIRLNQAASQELAILKQIFQGTVSDDELIRQIFLKGLTVVGKEMQEALEHVKKQAEELSKQEGELNVSSN